MPNFDGTGPRGLGPFTGRGGGVGRPRNPRCIGFDPEVKYFKPRGIPMVNLEEVVLQVDEVEALRLHDLVGLEQEAAAEKMKISQPTFARTLNGGYKKIADALVNGKAIKLEVDR